MKKQKGSEENILEGKKKEKKARNENKQNKKKTRNDENINKSTSENNKEFKKKLKRRIKCKNLTNHGGGN